MVTEFRTTFADCGGRAVAGTWHDTEAGNWALSTVPLLRFPTEQAAIDYFYTHCDHGTGLLRTHV